LRYLFQLDEEDLVGFSPTGSTRTTGAEIRQYLDTLMPSGAGGEPLQSFQMPSMADSAEAEFDRFLQTVLDPADVNGDAQVTARDALNVINQLANPELATLDTGEWSKYDANRDGRVTARDALYVINRLDREAAAEQLAVSTTSDDDDKSDDIDQLFADDTFLNSLF